MSHKFAVSDDAKPEEIPEADWIEPMMHARLIVRRAHLSVQRKIPSQHDSALIRIVRMGALRKGSPREVID